MDEFEEIYKDVKLKFISGNKIPVTMATITAKELQAVEMCCCNQERERIVEVLEGLEKRLCDGKIAGHMWYKAWGVRIAIDHVKHK